MNFNANVVAWATLAAMSLSLVVWKLCGTNDHNNHQTDTVTRAQARTLFGGESLTVTAASVL